MSDVNKTIFLNAAVNIGRKICRDAIWSGDRCNWITSGVEGHPPYTTTYFHSMSGDLYGGTSGIAYFLSSLYSFHEDDIIRSCAIGAVKQALTKLNTIDDRGALGFFSGRLGICYTAIKAGQILKDEESVSEGISDLNELMKKKLVDVGLDVIDGCAGAIPILLQLHNENDLAFCADYAIDLGNFLISRMQKENTGSAWDTVEQKKHNLTGFAHGASGIAHGLMELYDFIGDNNFRIAAEQGMEYERSHFNERQQNWPDFRQFDYMSSSGEDICGCAWCHGAPGIGLSRLRAFEITGNDEYKREVAVAVSTTLASIGITNASNFSLCHGLCGNSDLLIEASRVFGDQQLLAEAEKIGLHGINNYLDKAIPFPNGLNNSFENPELMTGLAGIGYFYLRLFNARKAPSILNLFVGADSVLASQ